MRPDVVRMQSVWCLSLAVMVLLSPTTVRYQPAVGKLEGHIRDSIGMPMPTAQVWVDGTEFGGVADSHGYYFIENIPPGVVDLTVSLVGYRRAQVKRVRILDGNTIAQDFSLDPISHAIVALEPGEGRLTQAGDTSGEVTVADPVKVKARSPLNEIAGVLLKIPGELVDSAKHALTARLMGSLLRGLAGQVTTGTGQPIQGATIEVDGAPSVVTGMDGKFLIQPPVGRKVTLRVSAQGFRTLETPVEKLKAGEGRRLFLRLKP